MGRFRMRYVAVVLALCVMLAGAAIAAAAPSDKGAANMQNNAPEQAQAKASGLAIAAKASSNSNSGNSEAASQPRGTGRPFADGGFSPPGLAIARANVPHAKIPHAKIQHTPAARVLGTGQQRYQWSGQVRYVNDRLVIYRGCDRWILDPQSRGVHEILERYADSGRTLDVWGTLSADTRHTVAAHAAYGANDPRPRILMPDYPCPRDEEPESEIEWVGGHITGVDAELGVIGLQFEDGSATRYRVTDETGIALDGERVLLSALEAGMRARIAYDSETRNALRIKAVSEQPAPTPEIEWASGWIVEVDLENRVVVFRLPEGGPLRVLITDETGIGLDGERVRLSALEPGMPARFAYDPENNNALRILALSN